jgi:hypothetical protein
LETRKTRIKLQNGIIRGLKNG